jgi:hypothetical protein
VDLSTVEQCVGDAVEQVGNLIGEHLLHEPGFGADVRAQLDPVIREVALIYGDCSNAAAVMADATQPIGTES